MRGQCVYVGVWGWFLFSQVPPGSAIHVHVRAVSCDHRWTTYIFDKPPSLATSAWDRVSLSCTTAVHFVFETSEIFFSHHNNPSLLIDVQEVRPALDIRNTSRHGGFLLLEQKKGRRFRSRRYCKEAQIPQDQVTLISVQHINSDPDCPKFTDLQWRERNTSRQHFYRISKKHKSTIRSFNAAQLHVCFFQRAHVSRDIFCFKLFFSFHSQSHVPRRQNRGLYNCSVEDYWRFQQHLDCNLKVECEDGRDEGGHCPYSSPACDGWVASNYKCYKLFNLGSAFTPLRAHEECLKRGSGLASIKTARELGNFQKLFPVENRDAITGLVSGYESMPFMYRGFPRWTDNTIIYNINHLKVQVVSDEEWMYYTYVHGSHWMKALYQKSVPEDNFICEKNIQTEKLLLSQSVKVLVSKRSSATINQTRLSMASCQDGHMTHSFLSCDPQSGCKQSFCFFSSMQRKPDAQLSEVLEVNPVPMYACSRSDLAISYSLVCDFRKDCSGGSDESFCNHPACHGFSCSSGQCIPSQGHCNQRPECWDESDERGCHNRTVQFAIEHMKRENRMFLIEFDGKGYFTQQAMNISEVCPDTHYRCRTEWIYCLPVYTRCNGYYDCIDQEDESDCETATCPGFYRCRDSAVCVHVDYLCDRWPHCPQHDDEWLCDMTCPAQCLCQGHAFLCPQPFSAHLFPQLRYLDARGSGMTPSQFINNTYVVRLNLAHCSIRSLTDVVLPNLQTADVSDNAITSIDMNTDVKLPNLRELVLQGNPLKSCMSISSTLEHKTLKTLDLSRTDLREFDIRFLPHSSGIQRLNISFSNIQSIGPSGFKLLRDLEEVDMRGNDIKEFSLDLFEGLDKLAIVRSPDYRLCCQTVLPDVLPKALCLAPQSYLSSCEQLLQHELHRLTFWFLGILASVGNMTCLLVHFVLKNVRYEPVFLVCKVNLNCANFCMGIYNVMIAAAHEKFRDKYLHNEDWWKDSVACKVAGFLSLVSCEVSVLTLFLLTLDHLIVLSSPLCVTRLSRKSAAVSCGAAWVVGIVLASITLLFTLPPWTYHGNTGMCNFMLPDTDPVSKEFGMPLAIPIFNCFFGLMISLGQVFIFKAKPKHQMLTPPGKQPAYASVDLLMKIALTDVVGLFSIGATTFTSTAGVAGLEKVNVVMAVGVLPLNPAVNPLLCLSHALWYRRQQKLEERILQALKSKANAAIIQKKSMYNN